MNLIKTAPFTLLACWLISIPASGTEISTSAQWDAQAVKKSEVKFNIFSNTDLIQPKWEATEKSFSSPSNNLTIQANGKSNNSAYKITSQLIINHLAHTTNTAAEPLAISVNIGGQSLDSGKAIIILTGTDKETSNEIKNINLAQVGVYQIQNRNRHKLEIVEANFSINKNTNKSLPNLLANQKTEQLENGLYQGIVELAFVASWAPATAN